ncbi:hypothetical protein [Chryseolinea sp. H1M3-3]|uniref:hypothetical protein n=1 Tax=Chryseolinea sp. H1M3-3 TaxID=3034144 RepID=UPI0023EC4FB6|nr:hypothetical protein [Chryseolinea sp. H1M3-3]
MKLRIGILGIFFLITTLVAAQEVVDSTGLPGDNFSLEGALELFKKSESPEAFEKMLNAEDSKVNNLDLNGDSETDYIKVIDRTDGNVHAFVLQAIISETESQDIAVIEIEEKHDNEATVQIVGDDDIYGDQKIVEPLEEIKTHAGAKTQTTVVNVYTWPMVRFVYGPSYRVWISPWGWRARPVWWHPWRPVRHHVFFHHHAPYRHRYVVVHTHRTVRAHSVYVPTRTTSLTVQTRHREPVNHYRSNKTSRTTTITSSPGKTTRKTTTVRTKDGKKSKTVKRNSRSRN